MNSEVELLKQAHSIKYKESKKTWIVSFSDLAALILVFFVLIFSISSFDVEIFNTLPDPTKIISKDIRFDRNIDRKNIPISKSIDAINPKIGLSLNYLEKVITAARENYEELSNIIVTRQFDRLLISMPSNLTFRPASAELNSSGRKILFFISELLENSGNKIVVAGHTDPTKITKLYPSNWELSLARAYNVATFLKRSGISQQVEFTGHADSFYQIIKTNLPDKLKNYLTRRVDISISYYDKEQDIRRSDFNNNSDEAINQNIESTNPETTEESK